MAFSRKFLAALGIEADKVDEIITAHAEVVDALKEERDANKGAAEELATTKAELEKLQAAAENANGENPYRKQYEDLKAEFDAFKERTEADKLTAQTKDAYRELLKEAGISENRLDVILKVTDLSTIKLDKDGKIEGADKLTEGIKTEWADFIKKEGSHGVNTATPPAQKGGADGLTKEKIMAIKDRSERQAAIAEHPDLFGIKLSGGKE